MPLFYSVPELKALREVYRTLGITNSGVLDQIRKTIASSHFDEDANEELVDLIEQYMKLSEGHAVYDLRCAIEKTQKMTEIHVKAKQKREVAV